MIKNNYRIIVRYDVSNNHGDDKPTIMCNLVMSRRTIPTQKSIYIRISL
jgi:hypothetical protein